MWDVFGFRLSALMNLYIILYPLWGPLVILSKYIHVTSCFEVFIETNLMVQSEFNLVLWFASYNIFFCWLKQWSQHMSSLPPISRQTTAAVGPHMGG
jgi:hypothetical protein